jgi:putative secretion ATPase (PEP-CTERM system associated)
MFDDFYGLTGRPFQLTPDPSFYFESATHRKALSYLGYGLAQGEGFIVITGEVGAGKSTLVAHLMRKVDPAQLTVGQIVTSNLDGGELIHVAAQSFGLEVEGRDKASALGAIEGFLHEEARAGRRCLLVVDESQNLSVEALEELRMLSNFQLGSHPLLQTLLLGQPEFKHLLAKDSSLEQLRQRVIAAHHLEAMAPGEVEPYVMHRLKCVGWSGNPAFDSGLFAELHHATGGIPRRLNQLMSRLMLLGAVEQKSRIDTAMLAAVRKEMDGDSAAAEPAAPTTAEVPAQAELGETLAERKAHIAELERSIGDLAETADASDPAAEEWINRLEMLELRVAEQDRAVRHVLTMLIEWFEGESQREAA